jgi:hypothetical protein
MPSEDFVEGTIKRLPPSSVSIIEKAILDSLD